MSTAKCSDNIFIEERALEGRKGWRKVGPHPGSCPNMVTTFLPWNRVRPAIYRNVDERLKEAIH